MKMKNKITALIACAALFAGCTKAPEVIEQGNSELDWSRTSTITLGDVAMASGTRADDPPLMEIDQTFRLYAIDPKTKDIIATRTYTIKGAAGKPVVDDSQDKVIELPFGVVDIFLVGPVKATLSGVDYDIAGPDKVTPMRGVDLISSLKRVTINAKETPIVPTPLQHRMVKLELVVSMVKDVAGGAQATYQDAYLTDPKHSIGIENMGDIGTFTFDNQGGSVIGNSGADYQYNYTEGNAGTGKIVLNTVGENVGGDPEKGLTGAVYTVTDYMIPTADTTPKLSVTYGYTRRDEGKKTTIDAHIMSGKTKAPQVWTGGTYVKISTTLIPSIDMTLRPQILPWDDGGTTPVEPPANNDLIFWYSGEDAPETIDGKLCWRDRSGNGNHAVINGGMVYDAVNKCYISTDGASFGVPSLGAVPEYTLEFASQNENLEKTTAANFNGKEGVLINIPYGTTIAFYNSLTNDWGKHTNYTYGENDLYIYEQLNSYAFCRNQTTAAIVINGVEKKVEAKAGPWADFTSNNLLWFADVGYKTPKAKLYGARMYKKYMNNTDGRNTLAANHAAKLSQLGVTAPLSGTTFDYVKDGLIVDLRSENGPTGTKPNTVWPDASGHSNSPTLDAGVYYTMGYLNGQYIYYGKTDADMLRFTKSLGTYKDITIEIVSQGSRDSWTNPIIQFSSVAGSNKGTNIYMGYPGIGYIFEAPWISNATNKVTVPFASLKYPVKGPVQISCSRRGDKLYASQYGYVYNEFVGNVPSDRVNELANGLIATAAQYFYAVRIYNRALSDMERQHNYLVDKTKYGLLSPN